MLNIKLIKEKSLNKYLISQISLKQIYLNIKCFISLFCNIIYVYIRFMRISCTLSCIYNHFKMIHNNINNICVTNAFYLFTMSTLIIILQNGERKRRK